MRLAIWSATALALGYLAISLTMFIFQRSLIYVPDRIRRDPGEAGLSGVTEQILVTPDGSRLVSWRTKAKPGRPTVLYFQGNGGHLAQRAGRIKHFQDAGFGVLMLAYRGYSGSTGAPSEAANVADALLAYDFLAGLGLTQRDIVLFGESLGTGVAVQVAVVRPALGLVLDSPFTSLVDAGQQHYPWLPVRWLIADRFDSLSRIKSVHMPLLILHGEADEVVPLAMGQAMFAAANEPKSLITFPGATHIEHTHLGSMERVREFVDALQR